MRQLVDLRNDMTMSVIQVCIGPEDITTESEPSVSNIGGWLDKYCALSYINVAWNFYFEAGTRS